MYDGSKLSPYLTTHSMGLAEEFILGDSCDCDNPFKWLNNRLNLTGDSKYSPMLPWVSNLIKNRNLVSEFWNYIDDIRSIESSSEEGWVVIWRISTYCSYLGIHNVT